MGAITTLKEQSAGIVKREGGLPLALVIARYFVYVFAAMGALIGVSFLLFMLLVSSSTVYVASYADEQVGAVTELLESGEMKPADLPACYHWTVFDGAGNATAYDMPEGERVRAKDALQFEEGVASGDGMFVGARRQVAVSLPDGTFCALQYDFLPSFTTRALRDALPNPQMLLIIAFIVMFVVATALIAMRASRVIARKMKPLVEAASHIEQQNLNFAVGSTNVREVNEVLSAMERMRSALNDSLRARWDADEARRRQIAALAHDLKTPLAIARWNADLLREAPLDADQETCAEALDESIERMDGYVRLLMETSQTGAAPAAKTGVEVHVIAVEVERQARQLCEVSGLVLTCLCAASGVVSADVMQLVRATMNLVANAVQYAPASSAVSVRFMQSGDLLSIVVDDEGPGFTPAALAHGKERFFRDAEDRGPEGAHYGLGLSIVEDIVAAHAGALTLSNREGGGASCCIEIPLQEAKREGLERP